MPEPFVDIHHHILYGLDDGPAVRGEMEQMISAAVSDGVGCIIATPHVLPGIKPFDRQAYEQALQEANDFCQRQGYHLRILGGAEILFTQSAVRMLREGRIPTLNGTNHVLVEWADGATQEDVSAAIRDMANAGFVPVLAHAERLSCFWKRPERLLRMRRESNIRVQMNCSTLLKSPFSPSAQAARRLCRMQMVDYVASDAHNLQARSTRMTAAYQKLCRLYGSEFADGVFGRNQMELATTE